MALEPEVPGAPAGLLDLRRGIIDHRRLVAQIFAPSLREPRDSDEEDFGEQEERKTIIHCAASQGNALCVAMLLAGGISCDLQDRHGRTALHWAAEQGNMAVVWTLGGVAASIDLLSRRGNTPLMLAAERGHEDIVRVLVEAGAGDNDRHERGRLHIGWFRGTPLHSAAKGGNIGAVSILIRAGFHREQRNAIGYTPAEVSARQGHSWSPAVTRLLLPVEDGGGQMVYDRVNRVMEDVQVIRGLVQAGACLDWQDTNRRETPLHRAVCFQHIKTLEILLAAGANPSLRDLVGGSPLHMAAVTGATAAAEALLDAGAETEARMMDSYCPLHLAVSSGRMGIVKLLLRAGASIEQRDLYHGASPLLWASRLGRTPMLHALLEAGANANVRCASKGLTCLHWACRLNRADTVDALLQAGADLDAEDDTGRNAYSMIGLGNPDDRVGGQAENSTERRRRLDPELTGRITGALKLAKRDRAWGRRGWLVVLAKRWGLIGVQLVGSKAKGEGVEAAAGASAGVHPTAAAATTAARTETGQGDRTVRQRRAWQQQQGAEEDLSGASSIPLDLLYGGHDHDGEVMLPITTDAHMDLDGVDDVPVQPDAACFRGSGPVEHGVNSLRPGTGIVEALLRVAAVETGVFRNVISFI